MTPPSAASPCRCLSQTKHPLDCVCPAPSAITGPAPSTRSAGHCGECGFEIVVTVDLRDQAVPHDVDLEEADPIGRSLVRLRPVDLRLGCDAAGPRGRFHDR